MKNSKKRRSALLFTALILSAALSAVSCEGKSDGDVGEIPSEGQTSGSETEYPAPDDKKMVFSPELKSFAVIRSDFSSEDVTGAAVKLRKAVEKSLGTAVKINTDWEKNETYDYELIIGSTEREKLWNTTLDTKSVGEKGFIIAEENGKVFIAGGSDTGTILGVNWFIDNIIGENSGSFELERGYLFKKSQEYDITGFYIGGTDSDSYPIICSEKNKGAAELLQSALYSKTGAWHEIVEGESGGSGFIISEESPGYGGIIDVTVKDGSLVFQSSSVNMGLYGCVESFLNEYVSGSYGAINFPNGFEYCELGDDIIIGY